MKTDSQLRDDVIAELQWKGMWQPKIDASHISVAAQSNIVTLSGKVVHLNEKKAAGATAKGVYGVKAVANELLVEPNGSPHHTDQRHRRSRTQRPEVGLRRPRRRSPSHRAGCQSQVGKHR